ncbi:YqcI/YcgG family protein [Paenibacillus cellulosilyticus]|nr:YqcI/YcgG family protein [Paenibacillus cellulosilyticus]
MNDHTKVPEWLENEYETFSKMVLNPKFPCYFGTLAEKRGEIRYTYVENNDYSKLPTTLASFLNLSRENPDKRQNLTVFFEPETKERPLEFYKNKMWEVLQYLHKNDSSPWPEHVPYDPQHRSWEFCFNGEPVFVFLGSPAYLKRHSRNYGNSLILIFQPTRIFNGFESDAPEGIKARSIIRSRLLEWDANEVDIPADSSKLGEKKDYYWKQYVIPDNNEPTKGGCPFHTKDND